MAHRYGERRQHMFFPPCIDDYISGDDPVRVYDAFVDSLDLRSLGIPLNTNKPGCSEYSPVAMLKVLLYGYAYGFRSSRKLERALHHNLSFIWLAGGLKPDDRTICRFRSNHTKALKKVFKQCARLCIKLNLIEGNTLFVDGTKLRANASYFNVDDLEKYDRQGINVIVPAPKQACDIKGGSFDRSEFEYVPQEDCYICPSGKKVPRRTYKPSRKVTEYALDHATCSQCEHYGICCKSKKLGRTITRYDNEALRQKLFDQYKEPSNQQIYCRRQATVELPFGHIKRNLGVSSFLVRGLESVRSEMSLLSSCFNMVRLIGLFGVPGLIAKLENR